jgi:predicted ATP-grasp superfamily ATP-dependent carboligase
MTKLSILIPDGESPFALHVIACLSRVENLRVHVLSRVARPPARYSRYVKSFRCLARGESLVDGIAGIRSRQGLDLCMPVDMNGILECARDRNRIERMVSVSLMSDEKKIRAVGNKGLLADFLEATSLSHPATLTSREKAESEIAGFSFPALAKPRLAGGGDGIFQINTLEEFRETYSREPDFFERYILQTYIMGRDIDCSVLCREGRILAYTIQGGLFQAEQGSYKAPDAIEFLHDPDVLQLASQAMTALNWNGVAHIDMRRRDPDGRLFIIEINPRYWGSLEGSLHVGVNFPGLAIKASLGETFPIPAYRYERFGSAYSTLKRKIKGKPAVSLLRETNFLSVLGDPLPLLARMAGAGA